MLTVVSVRCLLSAIIKPESLDRSCLFFKINPVTRFAVSMSTRGGSGAMAPLWSRSRLRWPTSSRCIPEYHAALEQTDQSLDRDYSPEGGQSNPYLHMGLHLAIRDQIATDRPAGVRAIFAALERRLGSAHETEHRLIERLAEALWNAQRSGTPPDEEAYLESLRRLL